MSTLNDPHHLWVAWEPLESCRKEAGRYLAPSYLQLGTVTVGNT